MSSWKKSWDHKNKEEIVSNDDIMVSAMKKKMKKIIKNAKIQKIFLNLKIYMIDHKCRM